MESSNLPSSLIASLLDASAMATEVEEEEDVKAAKKHCGNDGVLTHDQATNFSSIPAFTLQVTEVRQTSNGGRARLRQDTIH